MGTKYKQGQRIALVLALLLALNGLLPAMAGAGALSNTYMRLDRMMTGQATGFRLVFTTSADTANENNIRINFGSAFSAAVAASVTPSSASCGAETGATGVPGTLTSTGNSGGVLTISGVTNLAASTAYCVDVPGAITTLPAAGEYYVDIETRTTTTVDDSIKVALRIVSNDSITVTATVPPTFNFALDANATAFTADLTPGTKRTTTARTITVNTNAKTGWD